jgi:hypothetical protein
MAKVVIDAAMRSRLGNLAEAMQFTDESGRILGYFTPVRCSARLEPQISDAEVQRRLQTGGGRALAEILGALEKQEGMNRPVATGR